MKKPHKHDVKSNVKCRCDKFLKANVVERKPTADRCYSCFRADSKSKIVTASEARSGRKVGRVGGRHVKA